MPRAAPTGCLGAKYTVVEPSALGAAAGETMEAGEMERVFGIEIDSHTTAPSGAAASSAGSEATGSRRRGRPRTAVKSRQERRTASPGDGPLAARIPHLLRHFRKAQSLTNSDYRRLFSIEALAATRELGELTAREVLLRTGKKRGTRYLPGPHLQ